jgi:hypothetical protein
VHGGQELLDVAAHRLGLGRRGEAGHGRAVGCDEELGEVPLDRRAEQTAGALLEEAEDGIGAPAVDVDLRRQREGDAVVDRAELLDRGVVSGLLVRELVAREAEDDEPAAGYT